MPFGLSQRKKPTPERVTIIIDVVCSCMAGFIGWSATNDIMNAKLENVLTASFALLIIVIPRLKPLWGVDVQSKTVPVEKVTGIDTDT